MAVNNTTNQVYIPGFENNIASTVQPIAYTTTAAISSLQSAIPTQFSNLVGKLANPATSRDNSELLKFEKASKAQLIPETEYKNKKIRYSHIHIVFLHHVWCANSLRKGF